MNLRNRPIQRLLASNNARPLQSVTVAAESVFRQAHVTPIPEISVKYLAVAELNVDLVRLCGQLECLTHFA